MSIGVSLNGPSAFDYGMTVGLTLKGRVFTPRLRCKEWYGNPMVVTACDQR